jgi:hypothetical protein
MRKLVRLGALRALFEHDPHDLRNDVPCPLDNDGVADADVDLGLAADGQTVAVAAGDIVLIVERDVLNDDAADRHRREPRHRRERAGSAHLDIDLEDGRGRLLGGKLMRDGPARLAGDRTPAPLQIEPIELVDDAVDIVAE